MKKSFIFLIFIFLILITTIIPSLSQEDSYKIEYLYPVIKEKPTYKEVEKIVGEIDVKRIKLPLLYTFDWSWVRVGTEIHDREILIVGEDTEIICRIKKAHLNKIMHPARIEVIFGPSEDDEGYVYVRFRGGDPPLYSDVVITGTYDISGIVVKVKGKNAIISRDHDAIYKEILSKGIDSIISDGKWLRLIKEYDKAFGYKFKEVGWSFGGSEVVIEKPVKKGNIWIGIAFYFNKQGFQLTESGMVGVPVIVHPGSPVEKAGMKTGDVILSVDGKRTEILDILIDQILKINKSKKPGDKLTFYVARSDQIKKIVVTIEEHPKRKEKGKK